MLEPFVSVVTPVYNDDPYLEQCIKSVLAQTRGDLEYIVCNNHSTDRSGEIAHDLAATDSRIRVVSPPDFVPQAKNFNFALRQVSPHSRYIKMLCSDDWLFPEFLERTTALADANPSVGLVSAYRLIEASPDCFGVPVDRSVFPGREAIRWQLLGVAFPFGTPSTVLYRASAVREALPTFYPEDRFYFDVNAAFNVLGSHDFGFVHQVLSFSRYQPGAIIDEASHLHFWPLMHFVLAHEYGRKYLDEQEFSFHYARVRDKLYLVLGDSWLKDRFRPTKEALWNFQRKQLQSLGDDIRTDLLARGTINAAIQLLGNPLATAGQIVQAYKKPRSA
jgi:glycosyltransferase involved in cell wall biosynthesis